MVKWTIDNVMASEPDMPLWAGFSNNEIPVELGKLLTGQDYGGDAKKCMDNVASLIDKAVADAGLCNISLELAEAASSPPPDFFRFEYMTGDLVIGIDSSTTAAKAIAWTPDGRAVAEGRAPIALANPRPGWFEQEVDDWWTSCATALRQVTATVDPARIAGIVHLQSARDFRAIRSRRDRPLRPGTTWLDERAAREVDGTQRRARAKAASIAFPASRPT